MFEALEKIWSMNYQHPNRALIGTENSSIVMPLINIFTGVKYNVKVTMRTITIK